MPTLTVSLPLDDFDLDVTLRAPTTDEWRTYQAAPNRADGLRDLVLACVPSETASRLLEAEQDYPALLNSPALGNAVRELAGAAVKPAKPTAIAAPPRRHRVVAFADPHGAEHTWLLTPPPVQEYRAFRDTAGSDPDATVLLVESCVTAVVGERPGHLVARFPGLLDSPVIATPVAELTGLVTAERKKG